jgi:DNA-binding PadR family transcriptional regulator
MNLMKPRLSNPLALAVLALTFERPMHPYEMATTLKHRQKHESIKLRYGSLYTVIELLAARGLIRPKETSRGGKRPERTVYALTSAGHEELRSWMRDLIAEPAKEFPQFEAALCLLPVLPPEEAIGMLRERALRLAGRIAGLQAVLTQLAEQDLATMASPEHPMLPQFNGQKFPAIFSVESEYRLALLKAELAYVTELVRRVTEEGWGPVEMWREVNAACERNYQHENELATREPPERESAPRRSAPS